MRNQHITSAAARLVGISQQAPAIIFFLINTRLVMNCSAQTNLCTPAQYLAAQSKPYFAPGHHLPHLSRWGWQLSSNACIEIATNWGYTLDLGECAPSMIPHITDTKTMNGRFIYLKQKYPTKFALSAEITRGYPSPIPSGFYCTNSAGLFVDQNQHTFYPITNGTPVVSPEGPDSYWNAYAQYQISAFKAIHSNAPVAIILNDGENEAINVKGFAAGAWVCDPRVIAATNALLPTLMATNAALPVPRVLSTYAAIRVAHQMGFLTSQIRQNLPDREASVYYNTACEFNRTTRYQPWNDGDWNFFSQYGLVTNTDYPSFQCYYGMNGAWTNAPFVYYGKYSFTPDLLTEYLNCVGFNMNLGHQFNYSWVCGGWWQGSTNNFSDIPSYTGFLKCLYTGGMLAGVAGYFDYPNGSNSIDGGPGFDASFPSNQPPSWLQQIAALSRVHAFFWQLDGFLTNSDLISGPQCHSMSTDQPAYEFTNTAARSVDRVLARKLRGGNQWLVTAWASDKNATNVTVNIPVLGAITVNATASGSVYEATTTNLTLLSDPVWPSQALIAPTGLKAAPVSGQ